MSASLGTKARALNEAKHLLQSFGFNGFSFQHLADALGIRKASLYDHYSSKEELGKEILKDYFKGFEAWTETVSVFDPAARVGALFEIFFKFASKEARLCPLSVLIADQQTLPRGMQKELLKVFDLQETWLRDVIREGQKQKLFRQDQTASELASLVMSLGLGAQLRARAKLKPDEIRKAKEGALKMLAP